VLVAIFLLGPGKVSLDTSVAKWLDQQRG
jgi:hypothetical protein